MANEIYSVILKNRANGSGTEMNIELDEKGIIQKLVPKTVRSFDF